MKNYTCDKHLTEPRPKERLIRTLEQQRLGFEVNDRVELTDEYKKYVNNQEMGIGVIVKFKDPYEWEQGHSTSLVDWACGCNDWLDVGWLKKE